MFFLGYDIGSSSVKASLLNADNNTVISTAQYPSVEFQIIAHQPGWAEQDPEHWWKAVIQVTRQILDSSGVVSQDIKAIGIAYQMHGLVVVDKEQKVLRPAIIWCDSRAVQLGEDAFRHLGEMYCRKHLLNSPGNFTASKLSWVKKNEPEIFDNIHTFLLPGDFIAMRLSGETQTTYSGLSEGILYDYKAEKPAQKILSYYQIRPDQVAQIVPTFGIQAHICQHSAEQIGLSAGIPITYRAGDQPNNALSLKVFNPGEIAATAGTSGVLYGVTQHMKTDSKFRVNTFAHVNHTAEQRRLGVLLCINGSGIMYAWAKRNLKANSYAEMNLLSESIVVGSEGLQVLPFGNGAERILENKDIGAHIHGLQLNRHHKGHIFRSIQEGIAYSMAWGLDIMKEMQLNPTVIKAGETNLFQSRVFQQTLANLSNLCVELYNTNGATGAARAAGIGIGHYTTSDAFSGLRQTASIEPNQERRTTQETYEKWKDILVKELQKA